MTTARFERYTPPASTVGPRHRLDRNHGHHILDTGGCLDARLLTHGFRIES